METNFKDPENLRLSILHQLEIAASGNCNEEFLKSLKTKEVKVNWLKTFNIFKKQLSETFAEEFNGMWKDENLAEKINILNGLKEKYKHEQTPTWRPITGNIQPQSTSFDIQFLSQLKEVYSTLVSKEEEEIAKLKEELKIEWNRLELHQNKIDDAENYNQILCNKINERLEENIDSMSEVYDMLTN